MPILSRGHLHLPHSRPIVRVLRRLDLDQRPEIAHFCADLLVVGGHLPLGARRGSFFMATQRLPTLRYPGIFICTGIRRISSIPCVTIRRLSPEAAARSPPIAGISSAIGSN